MEDAHHVLRARWKAGRDTLLIWGSQSSEVFYPSLWFYGENFMMMLTECLTE